MRILIIGIMAVLAVAACSCTKPAEESRTSRLNVLLVVADDLGFTDLGAFGSEIDTPNLDSLATNGLIFSSFHASPNCSPTRAMLMSVTDNHIAGVGSMVELLSENQKDQPGYEGHLNSRIATMPELYKAAGFNTFLAGKWHLGKSDEASPLARGFDRSFALMDGGAGAFSDLTTRPSKRGYYYQMLALVGWSSLPWLRRIKQPTIVMHGDDDPIIPTANARLMTSLIPGAKLMIVDCGHLFMLTRARRVATVVKRFFEQEL